MANQQQLIKLLQTLASYQKPGQTQRAFYDSGLPDVNPGKFDGFQQEYGEKFGFDGNQSNYEGPGAKYSGPLKDNQDLVGYDAGPLSKTYSQSLKSEKDNSAAILDLFKQGKVDPRTLLAAMASPKYIAADSNAGIANADEKGQLPLYVPVNDTTKAIIQQLGITPLGVVNQPQGTYNYDTHRSGTTELGPHYAISRNEVPTNILDAPQDPVGEEYWNQGNQIGMNPIAPKAYAASNEASQSDEGIGNPALYALKDLSKGATDAISGVTNNVEKNVGSGIQGVKEGAGHAGDIILKALGSLFNQTKGKKR